MTISVATESLPYTVEVHESEADWLAARASGLGASEAAAILGLSRWTTPLQVWAHKRGLAPPTAESAAMRRGKRMEQLVAEEYVAATGRVVDSPPSRWTIYRSRTRPWMTCTPDRFVRTADGRERGVLELKTTTSRHEHEWDGGVPREYACQTAWQRAVLGVPWSSLAVLIVDSWDCRWFDEQRDEALEAAILEAGERFWGYVTSGEEPTATAGDSRVLQILRPEPTIEDMAVLPGEALTLDATIQEAKAQCDEWERKRDEAESRIKQLIGEKVGGILPSGAAYTYKAEKRKGYTKVVDPWEGRVLRRRAAK